jgi:hypothetical protein
MASIKGAITATIVIALLFGTAIPIACFVVGAQNKNATCDKVHGHLVDLPTWLIVTGIVALVGSYLMSILLLLGLFLEEPLFFIPAIVIGALENFWTVAWSVVGAIELFKYGSDCKADSMWVLTLVVLIFMWLSLLRACSYHHYYRRN